MIEAGQLKGTLRAIVAKEMPLSLELFDIEADAAINDALTGQREESIERDSHAQFGDAAVKLTSELIKLIAATVSLVSAMRALPRRNPGATVSTADLQSKWCEHLRREGIAPEQAERISTQFASELQQLLQPK